MSTVPIDTVPLGSVIGDESQRPAPRERLSAGEGLRKGQSVLTIDEAAKLLRVNRKTLYQAVKLGQVPGVVRLGRVIRLSRTALLHWMDGDGGPALGE
jgi:excisionase family DNA binding protein